MNGIEQLEALNPVPDYRGNPGSSTTANERSKGWLLAAVAAAAAFVVLAGSFALREPSSSQLDLAIASQDGSAQSDRPEPGLAVLATETGDRVLARLVIPAIDADVNVGEGVDVEQLRNGPGHYPASPLPGQAGNAAIAGHRTTDGAPFARLDELVAGDTVFVTTLQGTFEYAVIETVMTDGDNVEVLEDAGDNRLTLTADHPDSTEQWIVVVAELIGDPVPSVSVANLPVAVETGERAVLLDAPYLGGVTFGGGAYPYLAFNGNTDPLQSAQAFLMQYDDWGQTVELEVYEQTLRRASVRWVDEGHGTAGWIVLAFHDARYWVEAMTTDGINVVMTPTPDGGGNGYIESAQPLQVEVDRPVRMWLLPERPVLPRGTELYGAGPLAVADVAVGEVGQRVPLGFDAVADELHDVRFIFRNQDGEQVGAATSSLREPIPSVGVVTSTADLDELHRYLSEHALVVDWHTFDQWQSVGELIVEAPGLAPATVEDIPEYTVTGVWVDAYAEEYRAFVVELFDKFQPDTSLFDHGPDRPASIDMSTPAAGYVVTELPAAAKCYFATANSDAEVTINEVRNVAATPEAAIRAQPLVLEGSVIEFTNSEGTVLGYAQPDAGRPWTFLKVVAVEEVADGWVVDRWETTGC